MSRVFGIGPFKFASAKATVTRPPDLEDFEEPILRMAWMQRHIYWWLGDLMIMGERFHGDDIYQAVHADWSPDLLQRCIAVAAKIPPKDRNPNLSWSHHLAVIKLDPRMRKIALRRAEEEGWTSGELGKYARSVAGKKEMLEQYETLQDEDSAGSQE